VSRGIAEALDLLLLRAQLVDHRSSWSTIGADSSIPVTGTPFALSGTPIRPVPIASSSAAPPSASRANISTVGPTTSGAKTPSSPSYRAVCSVVHTSLLVMPPADQHRLGDDQ
jgi:hypothetical protein